MDINKYYKDSVNIDITRIFAAWLVLTVHISQKSGFEFSVGAKGVQLFFVLCGYLAFKSLENNSSAKEYYKRRLSRILPTYWCCLILIYLKDFLYLVFIGEPISVILRGQCGPKFLRYFFFLQCFLPADNWSLWNNHSALWTMSSFAGFYLVAPFLYNKLMRKFWDSFGIWLAFLIGTPCLVERIKEMFSYYPPEAHIEWFASMNPLTELYCFLGGVMLFIAIKWNRQGMYALIIAGILVVKRMAFCAYELLFILVVLIAVSFKPIIGNNKITKYVSMISKGSFALYLLHPVILEAAEIVGTKIGINNNIICHVTYLYVLCIGISYVLYYGIITRVERAISVYGQRLRM